VDPALHIVGCLDACADATEVPSTGTAAIVIKCVTLLMAFSLRKEAPPALPVPSSSQEPQQPMSGNQRRESVKETRRRRTRTAAWLGTRSASIIPADIQIGTSLDDYFSLRATFQHFKSRCRRRIFNGAS